jgi:nitroimidazol reductase NimA-like FMN-containing flavoprotein (pyridoxamine 5'-phosphate oxidase superfamily)
MSTDPLAHFRVLDATEIWAILARNSVGRLAYTFHDRVDIAPVHYVYDNGWLYGRTSQGEKLVTLAHHRWVAFEVDEVDGPYDWRSVVVHGGLYTLSEDDEHWAHALEAIRRLAPEALTDSDPAPFRTVLFRIAVQESSGREGRSGHPASAPPRHEGRSATR